MIALIDYGIGNLRSVEKALDASMTLSPFPSSLGATTQTSPGWKESRSSLVQITSDPATILAAEKVVLPGVGAFGDGMAGLRARGLFEVVLEVARRGTPLLGICVGMQLLFEVSEEMGQHRGLGLLPGRVRAFSPHQPSRPGEEEQETLPSLLSGARGRLLKVPHTGWNQLLPEQPSPLLAALPSGSFAYFNHSYYCEAAEPSDILATTWYGLHYPSVVGRNRLFGVQFHPEKSQSIGLLLLRNFLNL